MGNITEKAFRDQVKALQFAAAYLIYGEETYLKDRALTQLCAKAVPKEAREIDYRFFEGKSVSMDTVLRDCEILPMLGQYRLIVVGDYPFESSKEISELEAYLKDPSPSTVLVFHYDGVDFDPKGNTRFKNAFKVFSKYADCLKCEKKGERDLLRYITAYVQRQGKTIAPGAASYFLASVGSDLCTVFNELDKVCAYTSAGEVTRADVDAVCIKSLQARVYDISKAVLRGDYDGACRVLNTLFEQREQPVIILSVIASCFVDMYRAKLARAGGHDLADVLAAYNYRGREFALRNASRDSQSVSVGQLRDCIDILASADRKLKSTAADARLVLDETLVRLMMTVKGAAR